MTARILPREEWHRLAGTLLEASTPYLKPDTSIVVVEDGDQIVGCAAVWTIPHLDGVWVHPSRRGSVAVGRALLSGVRHELAAQGITEVWAMSTSPASRRLIETFGRTTHMDCDHFAVQMENA